MLDKTVEISGWHAGWISRTLPAFDLYANITQDVLLLSITLLGIYSFFRLRSYGQQLKANPSDRAAIFKRLDATVLRGCRANWYIAMLFFLNALAISGVDAYIGIVAIKDDVNQDPTGYDKQFIIEAAVYVAYITVVFMTTFFVVPLLQMLLVTSILARVMRKRGLISLSGHMLEARVYSTNIAQIWTIVLFFAMAWWKPSTDASLTRWIMLQAAMGSSLTWLDASFAFNFCFKKIADKDFTIGDGRLTDILRMFADTVVAVHTLEKGNTTSLPVYNDRAIATETATADEKTPLTA
ncbi:hypothetical protein LTR78_009521 [Recurvomyces mirabilis]|uniref:Transmembrane protein n=1 Tax=Recurvomyces mirabilis TaxID=574656 RepID=A0AAE0WIK1_9PEZI|nr:hypothetical protein LTR78_009521 [Recurvomyces mirabilis]KAK5150024.1 hypothetical protein LTS14_010496 [Recurvomyces mirabilis]